MSAPIFDFAGDWEINQGATFRVVFTWLDGNDDAVDLTSYTARMQIRSSVNSEDVLLELTTENGRIALGGSSGTVTLLIDAETTQEMTWRRGRYDIELIAPDDTVFRFMQGVVVVSPNVTR